MVALALLSICGAPRAWPRDRGRIAFAAADNGAEMHIFLTTPEGAEPQRLTVGRTWNEYPVWSRDGETIAFSSERAGIAERLFLMDADGGDQRPVSDGPGDWRPTWSPRGDALAFTSGRNGHDHSGVYLLDLESGRQTRLTALDKVSHAPTWRPGGGAVAYVSNRDGRFDLHLMDGQGRHIAQLTDTETYDTSPKWHPREELIAFASWDTVDQDGETSADIHTITPDGRDERRVTKHPAWDADPAWSPNGAQILFTSKRDGHPALFTTDLHGRDIRRVTDGDFVRIWGASWFDSVFPRGVSPIGRDATMWGWMKRLGTSAR